MVAAIHEIGFMNSRCRVLALLTLLCMGVSVPAQETSQTPAAPQDPGQEKKIEKKEQSRRMLGLPQFTVTDRKNAPPLTPKGKFRLFYKSAFDPAEFVVVGLQARYGAAFADQATSTFFADFAYPTLFKQDPRYFRLGEGSFKHRFGYAVSQIVIAHKDKGGRTFNWSTTLGALSSGSISNAYYPAADRGFGLTMNRAGISLLYGSLGDLGSEFWPDIDHKLFHRRPKGTVLPAGEQTQK